MGVLLPYQRAWVNDRSRVKVWEKSRRIGASWSDAADSALVAARGTPAGGMSTYYLSYNKDMTQQYVKDCANWAKRYHLAASEAEEVVLDDPDKDQTIYQVRFASGHVVQGLSSNPNNLRSKQGRVRIDEAAFVENLAELRKAALALIMWGGDVAFISTHNGESNDFNQLVQDVRSGRLDYSLHRTTLDDALDQGLYRAICKAKGQDWSAEDQASWRAKLIADYGDGADEELFCIPSAGSGVWLTRNLIESCMAPDIPVLRWTPPARDFVDWPLDRAAREVRDWCEMEISPLLAGVSRERMTFVGVDFGRSGDLTVIWLLVERSGLDIATPFAVELRNAPYRTQEQILAAIADPLPRLCGMALDARGNGQALAEYARQRFGASLVDEVMLSEPWYREHMPKLKAQLEDRTIALPRDADILEDLRSLRMVKGVAKPPENRGKSATGQRHADSAVALALAVYAAKTMEGGPVEYTSAVRSRWGEDAGRGAY